ncbi:MULTISPECIES: restriction endonuclease [Pseudomonas]|uniref:restriction endonuclease n=1 Tax=Pseudomonas TaxID=286 RepID=UPI001304B3A6|nr:MULTISPECIES: restriction endonuclease [unclassified Pseudomonas]
MKIETAELLDRIDVFLSENDPRQSELLLSEILLPLLEHEGYGSIRHNHSIKSTHTRAVDQWDLVVERQGNDIFMADSIGVEVKTYARQKVERNTVEHTLSRAHCSGLKRTLIFSKTGFSQSALALAAKYKPQQLELFDAQALRNWASGINTKSDDEAKREVQLIIKTASKLLINAVASNPRALDTLEWRDLERLMAEAFEGIGFSVTLTPSSKDGGKDLILQGEVKGSLKTYAVEIKHWRAGNRVGQLAVESFMNVLIKEKYDGGVFISTYGFTGNAFESLTKIQREALKFGGETKIVALCKTYTRVNQGLWSPEENLTDSLFSETA